ncbi:MAG: pseudaminic acid synthase [Candidatus Margulisiibacteriota bacterium]
MMNNRPFIIAEMSGNHNHSLERALKIVDAAADCGVDALKIQTYTADTMTIDCGRDEFIINDDKSLWKGKKLYDLYKEASTPWEWHKPIFERCRQKGITGFSTPFDGTAVDFLEALGCPMYKIASFEIVDLPLIEKAAKTRKPMLISAGMAAAEEIEEAVTCARSNGCPEVMILKCTSTYPAEPKDSNLLTIPDMAAKFKCKVGLSDHTVGIGAAIASIALGAVAVEKHFTLSRKDGGVDSAFSIEAEEMRNLVKEAARAFDSLGSVKYGPGDNEKASLMFRRSVYAVKDIKKGEKLTNTNVRIIRPGHGLSPKYYGDILGKTARKDIAFGEPICKDYFK